MLDEKLLELIQIEHRIKCLKNELDSLKKQEEEILSVVNDKMEIDGLDTFEDDEVKITRVKSTVQRTFDTKRFEQDNPTLFGNYVKEVERKGYMKIKLKGE